MLKLRIKHPWQCGYDKFKLLIYVMTILTGMSVIPAAQAKKWCFTDTNGITQVADSPRHRGYKNCSAQPELPQAIRMQLQHYQQGNRIVVPTTRRPNSALSRPVRQPNHKDRWDSIIHSYAKKYRVDPLLVKAVIAVESDFNPQAKSPVGAIGLMQIMPETGRWLVKIMGLPEEFYDLHDPEKNINLGVYFIAWLTERYNNDLELILAAYNAGPGGVARYHNHVPPYKETQKYIRKIIKHWQHYQYKS
ncbi:lytic transglycosylase domain-containing protein [Mixta mediterraneensis]|uniref:lytic transglycosylase domain-containing protein n=1 Tax=Mixta mediterraneensis TaxID=2758443 RepID=UPI0018735C6C|nr:lytic transglycosylase domain-containing protein [Mixta mediterraneensis]MBE5251909.1 lytic transglycosylase domain-containing protein [Mixta mediterraneensis]